MTKKNDWISLIEASYTLDGNDQDWLDNLFDRAEPLLDPGVGRGAWTFRCTPTTFRLERLSDTHLQALEGHSIVPGTQPHPSGGST